MVKDKAWKLAKGLSYSSTDHILSKGRPLDKAETDLLFKQRKLYQFQEDEREAEARLRYRELKDAGLLGPKCKTCFRSSHISKDCYATSYLKNGTAVPFSKSIIKWNNKFQKNLYGLYYQPGDDPPDSSGLARTTYNPYPIKR